LKTTNSGINWVTQSSGTSYSLYSVCYASQYIAWAVGYWGTLLKTTDGGTTWYNIRGGTSNDLNSIYFTDYLTGWAVGSYGTIIKTESGGVPVELTSFNAFLNKNKVELNWNTATELNNQGFEIHRKLLEQEYIKIGFVPGRGTTTEPQFYSFTDESLEPGKYQYRLKQIDYDGSFEYSNIIEVTVELPNEFSLSQNYPNPFNPTTSLRYAVGSGQFVSLKVYDVLGNEVATLVNEEKPAGEYEVEFNAASHSGNVRNLPSGVYFYQLQAGSFVETKKMILMK